MPNIQLNKHVSLTTSKDISMICKPLFAKTDISIMNFIRVLPNKKVTYLCDNHAWLENYFKNNYHIIGAFEQKQEFRNGEYVLWTELNDKDPIVINSREIFNINHGITLIRPHKFGYDFFNFGTALYRNEAIDILPQQREELNRFILDFYEKAKKLIVRAEKNAFPITQPISSNTGVSNKLYQRCYLGPSYDYSYLTQCELKILYYLVQGMPIPEIANKTNISYRTIEKHVENIKRKLNCKTQCQLGYLAAELGLERYWE